MNKSSANGSILQEDVVTTFNGNSIGNKEGARSQTAKFRKQRQSSAMLMSPLLDCTMPLLLLLV